MRSRRSSLESFASDVSGAGGGGDGVSPRSRVSRASHRSRASVITLTFDGQLMSQVDGAGTEPVPPAANASPTTSDSSSSGGGLGDFFSVIKAVRAEGRTTPRSVSPKMRPQDLYGVPRRLQRGTSDLQQARLRSAPRREDLAPPPQRWPRNFTKPQPRDIPCWGPPSRPRVSGKAQLRWLNLRRLVVSSRNLRQLTPNASVRKLIDIRDTAIQAVEENGVVVAGATDRTPIYRQGNLDLYNIVNLARRAALRHHKRVMKGLYKVCTRAMCGQCACVVRRKGRRDLTHKRGRGGGGGGGGGSPSVLGVGTDTVDERSGARGRYIAYPS